MADCFAMGTSLVEFAPRRPAQMSTTATAIGHAGEVLQGAGRSADGVHRFLCSLPAPSFVSRAEIVPTPGHPLSIRPAWAWKALSAAQLLLRPLATKHAECEIRIASNIPVAKGCGSSTADVVATLRALHTHLRIEQNEADIARMAVQAEGATDSSVLLLPTLYRHREGSVEETMPREFPAMHVIVVDAEPESTVSTLTLRRPRYSEIELTSFEDMRKRLRRAFLDGDAAMIGKIATASARANQPYLLKRHLEEIIDLVKGEGGHGVAAAHSGTVLAMLLPVAPSYDRRAHLDARLASLGMTHLTEFACSRTPQGAI